MKQFCTLLVLTLTALLISTAPALSQEYEEPISLSVQQSLDFGSFVAPNTGEGAVEINHDGSLNTSNIPFHAGDHQEGDFDVGGDSGESYTVTLPEAAVEIEDGNGNVMTVEGFSHSALGTILDSFTVGADLTVEANQEPGTYSGTFEITVEYE